MQAATDNTLLGFKFLDTIFEKILLKNDIMLVIERNKEEYYYIRTLTTILRNVGQA